jgi:hypothetical protein
MLVSSIARFNALKNNAGMQISQQMQSSANSFNGVQNCCKPKPIKPFSFNYLKSAVHKLNVLA